MGKGFANERRRIRNTILQKIKPMVDVLLDIATGASARAKRWKNEKIKWSSLIKKLRKPVVTQEKYKKFLELSKEDQGAIKDVGGFVGGYLRGGKRHPQNVLHRQILTLDLDFAPYDAFELICNALSCALAIHSTHKHSEKTPRYRLLIPLDREVNATEYEAIARRVAEWVGMEYFDKTTFEVNRLMFWPSHSVDAEYIMEVQEGKPMRADKVLKTYVDYTDSFSWPTVDTEYKEVKDRAKKQQDPTEKTGLIGAFCREYGIEEVIDKYLSDIYEPCDNGRYTYLEGSTAAGLVVYENLFAYSHHGTDPIGGQLCNAYDLVRIHKYGYLDTGESISKSTKEMESLILSDKKVVARLANEKIDRAAYIFDDDEEAEEYEAPKKKTKKKGYIEHIELNNIPAENWEENLILDSKGQIMPSSTNLNLILKNDPALNNLFAFNRFDNNRYLVNSAPWRKITSPEPIEDVDYSGLRNYIDHVYSISSPNKVEDAVALVFNKNSYHPVKNYLDSLRWDGKPRIDTLLIDYFGAVDNIYTREAIRKQLVAAVTRIYEPGTKYDMVLILVGNQGDGKSTFIKKLGKTKWFSDSFTTLQGKESFEQLQGGVWLVEIAELSALKKSEVEGIKQYLSKETDIYRPAYGRTIGKYKRQCVFFGTANNNGFLKDATGNRRFNPIDVRIAKATKKVLHSSELDNEVDQIWAEAVELYLNGEPLFLSPEANAIATGEQAAHSELDDRRGLIKEFLDMRLPLNWYELDTISKRMYIAEQNTPKKYMYRERVCTAEIWVECLNMDRSTLNVRSTRELNDIMRTIDGWKATKTTKVFKGYGTQRYYKRTE